MPCTYYLPGEEEAINARMAQTLREELDIATRVSCSILKSLPPDIRAEVLAVKEIAEWWARHQKMDEERLSAEKERKRENRERRAAQRKLNEQRKLKQEAADRKAYERLKKKFG